MNLAAVFVIGTAIMFVLTGEAQADPIFTPIFTALLVGAGLPTVVAGINIAATLAAVATSLVLTGITYLLTGKPKVPKPEDGKQAVQQQIPPRNFGYGRVLLAGSVMLAEEYNGDFFYVAAVVGHRSNQIVGYYLNEDQVVLGDGDWFGSTVSGIVDTTDGSAYSDNIIRIQTRLGLATETPYQFIIDRIQSGIWTTSHRGDGQTSIGMIARGVNSNAFASHYPFGRPVPAVEIELYRVFDPRDPSQSVNNEATWQWSQNAALCIMHFLCFSEFGRQADYALAILPVLDQWIEEADICDEPVARKAGGTEPRYRLNGWANTENDDSTVLQAMLAACDGWLVERGDGAIILKVGKVREPEVTLTGDDIAGYYIQHAVPDEDIVNRALVAFTSPEHDYTTQEIGPIENIEDQTSRGKVRSNRIELTWVQYSTQASRIAAREMKRLFDPARGRLDVNLSGINAMYERWIRIDDPSIPRLHGRIIENKASRFNLMAGGFQMQFVGSPDDLDTYDAATEELSAPPVPAKPDKVSAPALTSILITAEQIDGSGGSASVYLAVEFDEPDRSDLSYQVRWRSPGGSGPWTTEVFTDGYTVSAGRVKLRTGLVPANTTVEVQVASRASRGSAGPYSAPENVDTTLSLVPPASPTIGPATGGVGAASIPLSAPNSANVELLRVFRVLSGGGFGSAVDVSGDLFCSPNQSFTFIDEPPPGSYDYYAVAENSTGSASSPAGPTTAVVS